MKMIRHLNGQRPAFVLDTQNTTYVFSLTSTGHLEHLYYGNRIMLNSADECEVFREKREMETGNTIVYEEGDPTVLPEDMCLEFSAPGHGDIREPFVELTRADGTRSVDFLYDAYRLDSEPSDFAALPSSYAGKDKAEHLCVTVTDGDLTLELHYHVYSDCDVITRSARLRNNGQQTVCVERLLSTQVDIPFSGVCVTSFHGAWAREMGRHTVTLSAGKFVIESRTGSSSSRANPFFMVHEPLADEHKGSVYGFNLIYSGSHYAAVEVNAHGKTRIVSGIQPNGFRWQLQPGACLEAPEAVMTFSEQGFTGQSVNMHRFVREHIVRGEWKDKERPILLNSWEAFYFKFSEHQLVSLAKAAKKMGVELFVLDDGWFGSRNDDSQALGDWEPNKKKLPGGLRSLAAKINRLGMLFGVWVEPEMVNVNSQLYRAHPDWTMAVEGRRHSQGRHQRVLDLANPAVQDWMIDKMTEVFSSAHISYVKWDMNRIFSDVYSPYLPPEQQGETAHRYICGLYRVMRTLTERFPEILFEGCAAGGNRFDLGMLCYFPQIWGSDNTDAVCRAAIQEGYSYGYPQSCIGAHVSAVPNHQTLRRTPLDTRFNVASFGLLGYECDLRDFDAESRQRVRMQTALYKKWRAVLQQGQFYRIQTGNVHQWLCVSPDRTKAVGLLLQELAQPNRQAQRFYCTGLDPGKRYHFYNIPQRLDVRLFGSMINSVSPFHIKPDSLMYHLIVKAVKLMEEAEDVLASGEVLMRTGIALRQAFSGTGFNDKVRVFTDFSSRLYFIEAEQEADA